MSIALPNERPEAPLFSDGLGERIITADPVTGDLLQILRVRAELTAVPSFEFALRERVARLANFRHAYYGRVRRVDRTLTPSALAVVSDHVEGTRLSEILRVAHEKRLALDLNAAMCLIRQLVPAVALLHENARDVSHGLIAPERIVVTPNARLVIVEHVLGAAIEQLQFGRERLWQEFRVTLPATAGLPRFDHRADVAAMGHVALALVLGRLVAQDEYPHRLGSLLNDTPLAPSLRTWIARAMQLELRRGFSSAAEALTSLEEVLTEEGAFVAAPVALETFLSRYIASLLEPMPRIETPPPVVRAEPPAPPVAPAAAQPAPREAAIAPAAPAVPAPPPVAAHIETIAAHEPPRLDALVDLDGFTTEAELQHDADPLREVPFAESADTGAGGRSSVGKRLLVIAAVILALAGGGFAAFKFFQSTPVEPSLGTLVVQSNPPGVPVFVDGIERGVTPARLSLTPGAHILELRRGVPRVIPLNISAGSEVSQYLEFAEVPVVGQLAVQTDPPGAHVLVDGTDRGVAPITISDLPAGEHEVVLRTDTATARHVVRIQAGGTASLMVPLGAAAATGPVSGWISISAPFTLEIREGGRLIGTSDTERVMLAAGRHELELVNDTLGYRATRVVQVPPGKVAALPIELPRGVVNLNATPWAEVWIDGQRAGETPIGNLSVAIGPHEIIFRHPQFGEKRHAISVVVGTPVRLSVDMK